jgi:hypothetical protein
MDQLKLATKWIGWIAAAVALPAWAAQAQWEPGMVWATSGLKTPESALPDPTDTFAYVSNINGNPTDKDGNGFISKVSLKDGNILEREWATGLDAPKGMALAKDRLFVSDIDRLVEIDAKTGKIVARHDAAGAKFLNDVAADGEGRIYVSDSGTSTIWRLADGKLEKWLDGASLKYPNGLYVQGDKLIVAAWGAPRGDGSNAPANLLEISLKDKSVRDLGDGKPIGNLDGIAPDGPSSYLVTDWIAGGLYRIDTSGRAELLLDLDQGSADIGYVPEQHLLLIPMMKSDNLIAYRLP